jgi:hypothetical protein
MAERSLNSSHDTEELRRLEARIALALESAPQPEIPAGFAARVAAQAPPIDPLTPAPSRYGRYTAMVCVAILLALIFLAARHSADSPVWISVESLLCLQLALIAIGLTARSVRSGLGWFR